MSIGYVDTYQVGMKRCPLCGGNRGPKEKKRPMCPRCHNEGIIAIDERPEIAVPQVDDFRRQATWDNTERHYIDAGSGSITIGGGIPWGGTTWHSIEDTSSST
jgi:hypothetical protein